jgi:hypothetical protein
MVVFRPKGRHNLRGVRDLESFQRQRSRAWNNHRGPAALFAQWHWRLQPNWTSLYWLHCCEEESERGRLCLRSSFDLHSRRVLVTQCLDSYLRTSHGLRSPLVMTG